MTQAYLENNAWYYVYRGYYGLYNGTILYILDYSLIQLLTLSWKARPRSYSLIKTNSSGLILEKFNKEILLWKVYDGDIA